VAMIAPSGSGAEKPLSFHQRSGHQACRSPFWIFWIALSNLGIL
jgi:hypothetical protein